MVEKDFFFLNAVKSGMPYRGVRYRTMHVLYTTLMRLTAINYQDLFVFSQDIAHEHS